MFSEFFYFVFEFVIPLLAVSFFFSSLVGIFVKITDSISDDDI